MTCLYFQRAIPGPRRVGARQFVGLLVAGLLLGRPVAAMAQESRYGVVHDNTAISLAAIEKARLAGFGWMRYIVHWSGANPAADVYDWAATDRVVAQAQAVGIRLYMNLSEPPSWLAALPPDRIQAAFENFARTLITRYRGRVQAWGFGSEFGNTWGLRGVEVTTVIARVLRPGYRLVKELDPAAPVVGPDEDKIGPLDFLLSAENTDGTLFDVISFHILRHSLDTDDPRGTKRMDQLGAVVAARGRARPVWLTELGIRGDPGNCNDELSQSAWLRQAFQDVSARPWITGLFVYRLIAGGFGLLYADGSAKPAWHELRATLTGVTPRSYLAEGATGSFFDLDVAVANPHCSDVPARITFLRPDGSTVVIDRTLAPRSRQTISVDGVAGVQATDVSTVVESLSGPPLVVERTMFWDSTYYAGHTGSAIVQPGTRWYFGEGSQGFFDTWVLLANARATPAFVTVRFLREGAGPVSKSVIVNPTSRLTLFAGSDPELVGTSFSIAIESNQPIIAERAMYFGREPFWNAGHESAGVPAPSTVWLHAEGATGPYFDTYVLVGNPNEAAATVTFRFLLETGDVVTRHKLIPSLERLTVNVEAEDARLANTAVSVTVSSDLPVVSERAMYWPGPFTSWQEAHNSFGVNETATRWALAEGRVGLGVGFETYVLLANPNETTARVRMTFLRGNGLAPSTLMVDVAPTSRQNVYVNGLTDPFGVPLVSNEHFGALIESVNDVGIVVERAMYWNAVVNGQLQIWAGGTNATAVKLP